MTQQQRQQQANNSVSSSKGDRMTQAQNSVLLNNLNHAMSRISWTFFTQNFWIGCTRVGDACLNCYIGRGRGFGGKDPFGPEAPYLTKTWDNPAEWQAELAGTSQYVKVFTCSLSDFFHKDVDKRKLPRDPMYARIMERSGSPYWRDNAWQVIKDSPNCVYQILTKRPERIIDHLPKDWNGGWPNVWLGTSVGCESALPYIDHLRKVPIHPDAVRFISAEPLLEDISKGIDLAEIGWLICGGESGPGPEHFYDRKHRKAAGRRIMQLDWAYDLLQKCRQQRTPYFFKQITDSRAGQGSDALGRVFHEFPNPPAGGAWWVNKDPLAVLQSANGGVCWTEREDE
jgi:protein gp37